MADRKATGIEPVERGRQAVARRARRRARGSRPTTIRSTSTCRTRCWPWSANCASGIGHHAAFAGLALQLSADGYAQLPGADWGYDEQTVERFVRETGDARARAREPRDARQADRDRVSRAVARMAVPGVAPIAPVACRPRWRASKGSAARLYLAGRALFERPEIEQALRPTLAKPDSVEAVLRSLGIDPKLYQASRRRRARCGRNGSSRPFARRARRRRWS